MSVKVRGLKNRRTLIWLNYIKIKRLSTRNIKKYQRSLRVGYRSLPHFYTQPSPSADDNDILVLCFTTAWVVHFIVIGFVEYDGKMFRPIPGRKSNMKSGDVFTYQNVQVNQSLAPAPFPLYRFPLFYVPRCFLEFSG